MWYYPIQVLMFYRFTTMVLQGLHFFSWGVLIFSSLFSFPHGSDNKESAYIEGDPNSILGLGSSPGKGNGYPLQYTCLENSMDWGARWATIHRVTKEWDMIQRLNNNSYYKKHVLSLESSQCAKLDGRYIIKGCGSETLLDEAII